VEDSMIRGYGPTVVRSKPVYLLSGPVDTSTSRKAVTDTFFMAAQPTPNPDLEQFWNVELVGITS